MHAHHGELIYYAKYEKKRREMHLPFLLPNLLDHIEFVGLSNPCLDMLLWQMSAVHAKKQPRIWSQVSILASAWLIVPGLILKPGVTWSKPKQAWWPLHPCHLPVLYHSQWQRDVLNISPLTADPCSCRRANWWQNKEEEKTTFGNSPPLMAKSSPMGTNSVNK